MKVMLHIYDMGDDEVAKTVNELFRPAGLGAFHGAVEVYGWEWSYGQSEEGSGVFSVEPKGCRAHSYRESHYMGETILTRQEVGTKLRELNWRGVEYDLLRHNCCHWCDAFCQTLGVGPIPAWVNQLAGQVAQLDDGIKEIDDNFRKAAASAHAVIEDARSKTVQVNKQILDTVEAKADEIRGSIEEFLTEAEELGEKLVRSVTTAAEAVTTAAEDIQLALDAVADPFRLKEAGAEEEGSPDRRSSSISPLWPVAGDGSLLDNDFLNNLFGFSQRDSETSSGANEAACSSVIGDTSSDGANSCRRLHAHSWSEEFVEPKQPAAEDDGPGVPIWENLLKWKVE